MKKLAAIALMLFASSVQAHKTPVFELVSPEQTMEDGEMHCTYRSVHTNREWSWPVKDVVSKDYPGRCRMFMWAEEF